MQCKLTKYFDLFPRKCNVGQREIFTSGAALSWCSLHCLCLCAIVIKCPVISFIIRRGHKTEAEAHLIIIIIIIIISDQFHNQVRSQDRALQTLTWSRDVWSQSRSKFENETGSQVASILKFSESKNWLKVMIISEFIFEKLLYFVS